MLYMLLFADGPHKTAHYAICTGFMALGMMIPGMWSGWVADMVGYKNFFVWVICSALPGLAIALLAQPEDRPGIRQEGEPLQLTSSRTTRATPCSRGESSSRPTGPISPLQKKPAKPIGPSRCWTISAS